MRRTLSGTEFECRETEEEILWHVVQTTATAKLDTEIRCKKKDMLHIRYEAPTGLKRHNRCEPHWVQKLEEGRRPEVRRCIGCLHCISSFMEGAKVGKSGECALNPGVGHEAEYEYPVRDGNGRKIVVIGAGIAGLVAAETMARRGFSVTVLEREQEPGGQVRTAAACTGRGKLFWCVEDRLASLKALAEALAESLPRVFAIGDAVSGGTIAHAVKTAYEACMQIV